MAREPFHCGLNSRVVPFDVRVNQAEQTRVGHRAIAVGALVVSTWGVGESAFLGWVVTGPTLWVGLLQVLAARDKIDRCFPVQVRQSLALRPAIGIAIQRKGFQGEYRVVEVGPTLVPASTRLVSEAAIIGRWAAVLSLGADEELPTGLDEPFVVLVAGPDQGRNRDGRVVVAQPLVVDAAIGLCVFSG